MSLRVCQKCVTQGMSTVLVIFLIRLIIFLLIREFFIDHYVTQRNHARLNRSSRTLVILNGAQGATLPREVTEARSYRPIFRRKNMARPTWTVTKVEQSIYEKCRCITNLGSIAAHSR